MAREIVTWCDPCMGTDTRTPGREYVVAIGSADARSIDGLRRVVALCQQHHDELLKPLTTLVEEYGAPVEGGAAPKQNVDKPRHLLDLQYGSGVRRGRLPEGDRAAQCLWCPLTYSNDNGGLMRHIETVHGLSNSIRDVFGQVCPICGLAFDLVGAHVKKTHADMGFTSITQAFLWARENGDPHGVYAKIVAKAPILA